MAVAHISTRLCPLTIPFTAAERRRFEAVARSLNAIPEKYSRALLMAAVRSIEDSERAKSRRRR
jgi:hypothetical protein